jgi:hypothetical protein
MILEEKSMIGGSGLSKESVQLIIIPLTNEYRKQLRKFIELDCDCNLKKTRISKIIAVRNVLDEIHGTQNWKRDYSPNRISRYALAGKLLIKSPRVLRGILFHLKGYDLTRPTDCQEHSIKSIDQKSYWYSNSASRIGFPWSREVFINSFNVVRDAQLVALVFSYFEAINGPNDNVFCESVEIVKKKLQENVYVSISQRSENKPHQVINSWKDSELLHLEKAEIWHGTVLLSNRSLVLQDKTSDPAEIPGRMTPCSVWSDLRLESPGITLVSPHAKNKIEIIDSGLFINASLSFYHFISESLRPLVQCIENQIQVSNIIIRNDLPFQFYELLRFLSPNSVQTLIGRGEKVLVTNLLAGVLEDRLSFTNKVFSEYSLEDLKITDEWRVWSYLRGLSSATTLSNEVLYLRRGKSESRGIQNSVSLEKSLSKNGFKVLDTSKAGFYSQYLHFNNSKLVCSTSGASLANMIFMPTGSTLLEITYPFGHSWKFLADLCGVQHINFPISSIKPKQLENALDTYFVKKKKLNNVIRTLI